MHKIQAVTQIKTSSISPISYRISFATRQRYSEEEIAYHEANGYDPVVAEAVAVAAVAGRTTDGVDCIGMGGNDLHAAMTQARIAFEDQGARFLLISNLSLLTSI